MPAASMNFGIYNSKLDRLEFPGTMEKGEKLGFHWANMNETHKLPVVCYKKEQEILINDLKKEAKLYTGQNPVSLSEDGEIVDALIYIPLYSRGKLLGVISVQSFTKNSYEEYHLQLLKYISSYVGIAIENAQLYEQMEEEVERRTTEVIAQKTELESNHQNFTTISEIGKDIISSLSIEEILEKAYDNINKLMDAKAFAIGIYNESMRRLDFPGAIENGVMLPFSSDDLSKETFAAKCFNTGEEVVINSITEHFKLNESGKKARSGETTESLVYLPLKKGEEIIGVITVQSFKTKAYSAYHIDILKTLANYTAIALVNARSFESITTLSEIGKEISSTLELNSVLNILYTKVNELMDAPIFMVSSYSENTDILSYELCIENGKKMLEGLQRPLGGANDNFSAWTIRNKKEIIIGNSSEEHKKYVTNTFLVGGEDPNSLIFIPLIVEDKAIGILSVQSLKFNAYAQYHLEILRSLSSYVSVALNNAIAYKQLDEARNEMKRLSVVASETDNAVIIMDQEGNFEWVNKAYEKMSGFSLSDLINQIGKSIRDIDDKNLQKHLDIVSATKKSTSFESSFYGKAGNKIWVQTNISPVLNENGEIIKLVALDSNITDRKEFELKIREKNKDITDSINYASRIQRAMLPNQNVVKDLFPNSFILYKPRDIVSGDFYWMTETPNNEIIVATVDCTGHGVPGAFLTIVGNNLLNQIVNFNGITEPGEILQEMNRQMLEQFEGTAQGGMKDGMDMSLCRIKYFDKHIQVDFSGAFNSIYHICNNNLTEIKANRFSIGTPLKNNPVYDTHSFVCNKGDLIYLSTDGYQDQVGGERGKKFKKLKFQELLLKNQLMPIDQQRDFYNDTIENWRGTYPQLDDILLMGISL